MSSATDSQLGWAAVELGLLSPEQLDECRRLQSQRKAAGRPVRLRVVLVGKGYLDEQQVSELESTAGRGDTLADPRPALDGGDDATVYQPRPEAAPAAGPADETLQIEGSAGRSARATGAPPELPAPFGRYRLDEEVGRGGMGVVYKAWDPVLARHVAVKMLLLREASAAEDVVDRFLREARSTARLRHPNIVQILDIGTHQDRNFFTMEFVEGISLEALLDGSAEAPSLLDSSGSWLASTSGIDPLARFRTGSPYGLREVLCLVRALARAIEFAHDHGIVHRDIKPANILIDRDGAPRLTDFGLAKELGSVSGTLTVSGALLGTPSYMSPEQARGQNEDVGPATDIHALGVVFYEILTGQSPFDRGSLPEILVAVAKKAPPAPSAALARTLDDPTVPPFPREVEAICCKCLEKDAADRYATAGALAADIEAFLAGEPIEARPGKMMRQAASRRTGRSGRHRGVPARRRAGPLGWVLLSTGLAVVIIFLVVIVIGSRTGGDGERERLRQAAAEAAAERDWEAVDRLVEQLLTLAPDDPDGLALAESARQTRHELARKRSTLDRLLAEERWSEVVVVAEGALALDPGATWAGDALELARDRLAAAGGPDSTPPDGQAERRRREAEVFYNKARFRPVENRTAWLAAIEQLDRALAIDPRFGDAFYERGLLRMRVGLYEAAVVDLERSIELRTAVPFCHYFRGWILFLAFEDHVAAHAEFARAAAATDSDYAGAARAWQTLVTGDLAGALDLAADLEGQATLAYDLAFIRGLASHRLGRLEDADLAYTQAIATRPSFSMAYTQRAYVRFQMDRQRAAQVDCERALEFAPDDPRALEMLAVLQMKAENWSIAIEHLDRAVAAARPTQLSPRIQRAQSLFARAIEHHRAGRAAEAAIDYGRSIEDFETFLAAAPASPRAEWVRQMIDRVKAAQAQLGG